jgi:hypothetical protein
MSEARQPVKPVSIPLQGSRGLWSNVSTVAADPQTFKEFVDLTTDIQGRIRKRPGKGAVKGGSAGSRITAIHEFAHVNTTTGAVTSWKIRASLNGIDRWTGAAWGAMTLPNFTTTGTAVPQSAEWIFWNFGNKVYAVNSYDDMIVFDGSGTAWKLAGVTGPAVGAGYTLAGKYTTGGAVAHKGSRYVTSTGLAEWETGGTWDDKYIDINGIRYQIDTVDYKRSVSGFSGVTLTETFKEETTASTAVAGAGTVSIVAGNTALSGVGTSFLAQLVVGNGIRIGSVEAIVRQVISDTSAVIAYGWEGATVAGASFSRLTYSTVPYEIHTGLQSWGANAPRYCYAYSNPTTLHVSNRSPITEITERDVAGETVTLTGITYSPTAFANGYTEIVIYRSAREAFIPVMIDTTIANSNVPGTTTFTETVNTYQDSDLTAFAAASSEAHGKPPVALSAIAEYQGRIVGTRPRESMVYFSATREEVLSTRGLAQECWPPAQQRPITEPRGLVAVGGEDNTDAMVVMSARGDYAFDGNDNRTYNLYRIPTRESGGRQGRAAVVDGRMVQMLDDQRIWYYGELGDIGTAIQDKLDTIPATQLARARVFWFSYRSRSYLFIATAKAGAIDNDVTYVFDADKREWYEWNFGLTALGAVHDSTTNALELWAGDTTGAVYSLLVEGTWQDAGANFQPRFRTQVIRPLGSDGRVRLSYVRMIVSDAAVAWTGKYAVEEADIATLGQAITFDASDHRYQGAAGREIRFTPTVSHRSTATAWEFEVTFPATNGDLWISLFEAVFEPDLDEMQKAQQ